ncbi:hypothetical protein JM664_02335 [Rhodobacteraceae bacterium MCCB 386]|nr:hypothetical protein [Roseitranquillus sediminis]
MPQPFIRPELRAAARRWRETLAGAAVAVLGAWWALTGRVPLSWIGIAMLAGGILLALAGVQRARFRTGGGGPGVVVFEEGQLTYFGPLSGGTVAVRELERLAIDPRHKPPHWVLEDGQTQLMVPVSAEGADALFDVFSRLPGLDTAAVLAALDRPPDLPVTLWRKAPRRLH